MKYLRTDIYDFKANGELDLSSEIAERWSLDEYEDAIAYLVKRGADESDLRQMGITGNGEQSFSVCVWDDDEWLDNASEAAYQRHMQGA